MPTPIIVFAYFGPETVLPVTSIIATVVGVVMMMGRSSLHWMFGGVKNAFQFCFRRGSASKAPHTAATRSANQEATETAVKQ